MQAIYPGLDEFSADGALFGSAPAILRDATPGIRREAFRCLFDNLRRGLASETTSTTLQHALLCGLELTCQLEEGETSTEPVPSREKRNAILVYEATEGGAGVLTRVLQEPNKLGEVARAALDLMHFQNLDAAIEAQDPALLRSDPDARCVKGCYRCLLS
jgi:hypothetical protein